MQLRVKNLTVKYLYGAEAVSNLSFESKTGEVATVFATSEGGKTTLLKTLAGLVRVSEGQILLNNVDITKAKCKDRDICLIYNEWGLFNRATVEKNLLYPLKMRKVDKEHAKERVKDLLEKFQLNDIAQCKVKNLTVEQKIAVVFCRAFVRDASLYMIDNIFSHIKGEEREKVFNKFLPYIKELSSKAPLVFGTDSKYEAEILGQNLIILNYGIVLQKGSYQDIAKNPMSLFVCKMFFGDNIIISDAELLTDNNILYIEVDNEKIYLDRSKLINDVFIGKTITIARKTNEKQFFRIFDKRSEQIIYFG